MTRVSAEQFQAHSSRYGGGWEGPVLPGAAWWPPKVSLEDDFCGLRRRKAPSPAFQGRTGPVCPGQVCPAATSQKMLSPQGTGLQLVLAQANPQPDGNSTPQLFFTALSPAAVWVGVYR